MKYRIWCKNNSWVYPDDASRILKMENCIATDGKFEVDDINKAFQYSELLLKESDKHGFDWILIVSEVA